MGESSLAASDVAYVSGEKYVGPRSRTQDLFTAGLKRNFKEKGKPKATTTGQQKKITLRDFSQVDLVLQN
jgi:hypothetical protein